MTKPVLSVVETSARDALLAAKTTVLAEIATAGQFAGIGEDSLVTVMKRYLSACAAHIMTDADAALVWETYSKARNAACLTGKVLETTGKKCKSQISEIRAVSNKAIVAVGTEFIDRVMTAKRELDTAAGKAVTRSPSKSVYEAVRGFRDYAATKANTAEEIRAVWSDEIDSRFIANWISKEPAAKMGEHDALRAKIADFIKVLIGDLEKENDTTFRAIDFGGAVKTAAMELVRPLTALDSLVSADKAEMLLDRQVKEFEAAQA